MEMWGRVADAAALKTDDKVAAGIACAHFGNSLRVNGDCGAAFRLLDRAEELLRDAGAPSKNQDGEFPLPYPPQGFEPF